MGNSTASVGSVNRAANVKKSAKRRSGIFLLEPRVMYDGAGAATAAATTHHHHDHGAFQNPAEAPLAGQPPGDSGQLGTPSGNGEAITSFVAPTTVAVHTEPTGLHPGDNVVFIDDQIANYQAIVAAINPGTKVFVFDGTQDGLAQIAADLQGVHGLASVDIITHGAVDELQVGTDTLTTGTIATYQADLAAIGKAVAHNGQIDLYGCDVAAAGDGFIEALQQATGRNVAASTTPIGATALGGTWTLDATTAPTPDALPANLAALQSFDGILESATAPIHAATTSDVVNITGTATDSAGDIFVVGDFNGTVDLGLNASSNEVSFTFNGESPSTGIFLVKYNSAGVIQWADDFTGTATSFTFNGNPGPTSFPFSATASAIAVSADGSLVVFGGQYSNNFIVTPVGAAVAEQITSQDNDSLFLVGLNGSSGSYKWNITNQSNPINPTTQIGDPGNNGAITQIAIDSNDNVDAAGSFGLNTGTTTLNLIGGTSSAPANTADTPLTKITPPDVGNQGDDGQFVLQASSAGAINWGDSIANAAITTRAITAIGVDGSDNVFIASNLVGGTANGAVIDGTSGSTETVSVPSSDGFSAFLAEFNSSGVITATTTFVQTNINNLGNPTTIAITGIAFDSSGPVIVGTFIDGSELVPGSTTAQKLYTLTSTYQGTTTVYSSQRVFVEQFNSSLGSVWLQTESGDTGQTKNAGDTGLADDSATAITVDAAGNIVVGGSIAGGEPGFNPAPFTTTPGGAPLIEDTTAVFGSTTLTEESAVLQAFVWDLKSSGTSVFAGVMPGADSPPGNTTVVGLDTSPTGGVIDVLSTTGTVDANPSPTATDIVGVVGVTNGVLDTLTPIDLGEASPPVVTAGATVTFDGGGNPVTLDPGLTITDSNGAVTSATISITSGLISGDTLNFTSQNGITEASFTNGVLTLTGSASAADYQTALESITYSFSPTDGDPTHGGGDTTRTISWQVTDVAALTSTAVTSTLDTVHVAPTVVAGATATFDGGSATAVKLDSSLTVTDVDSNGDLIGATVTISSGLISGDTLNFANQNGISGVYSNGVLTLTGTATVAQYQTALDSVTFSFSPTNGDPTNGGGDTARTITWTVTDGSTSHGTSNAVTSTLDTVHEAPTVMAGATVTFNVGGSPVTLDSGLTVADVDSGGNLTGATVTIGTGFVSGDDTLNFTAQNGITESSFTNGVLTLTGTATIAQYQAALDSITFSTTANSSGSRTIDWTVKDAASSSVQETSTVTVQAGPVISAGGTVTFTGGSATPVVLDAALTVSDADGATSLTSATVTIGSGFIANADTLNFTNQNGITGSYDAAHGVLTLTGTATLAQYQAALESVSYSFSPTNGDPTGGGADTARTISWQTTDTMSLTSSAATSTLDTLHVAPTVVAGATATFTGGGSPVTLDGALTVTDVDSGGNLTGATVTISSGLLSGDTLNFTNQNGIAGVYSNGVLTLTGNATIAQYQTALDSVTYSFTPANGDPTNGGADTARTISWTVTDGSTSHGTSAAATSTLDTVHVAPTVVAGGTATFDGGGSAVTLDGTLTVTDVDSGGKLAGATVTISSGLLSGDTLNFTNQSGITGVYSNGVLTLTGTATVAQYQTALNSISYSFSPTNSDPTGGGVDTARTVSWTVTDGSTSNGSATATSTLTTVHEAPTVVAGGTATFTGGSVTPVTLDGTLTVADVDSGGNLTGATVTISSGLLNGDTLNFTTQNGITGVYSNGALTLTGTSSVANYQAALDSVSYSFSPTNGDPTGGGADTARTISWTVTDGSTSNGTSASVTSTLDTVHVAPTLSVTTPATPQTFDQGGAPTPLDDGIQVIPGVVVTDVDSNGLLAGATVRITSGLLPGDTLSANTVGTAITASYSNGVLTLSGADTIADYQAVLRTVNFSSAGPNPTSDGADPSRTISWSVNDGGSTTATTSTVNVSARPTVVAGADVSLQALSTNPVVLDPTIGAFDDTSLTGATVTVAGGFQAGDILTANTANTAITASYTNGVLTLTGSDTAQHYQAVLASVALTSTQTQTSTATIDWQITDQKGRTSAVATSTVHVAATLAPPPTNNIVANTLPATTVVNNLIADFSGLVTSTAAEAGDLITPGAGFNLTDFNPASIYVIYSDITASIGPDGAIAFDLPLVSLEAALGGDVVSVTASLANGQPLPAWLHFDARNGQFAGLLPDDTNIATGSIAPGDEIPSQAPNPNVPETVPESITIEIVARDSKGNISITDFTVDLSVRAQPKHGSNLVPGALEHWGMLRDAVPISGEPILWHDGSAADSDRGGLIHTVDQAPAGRTGFSEQLKVHGLHALNTDRAALLKNLRHVNWR